MLKKSFSTVTLWASAVAGIVGSGWLLGPLVCARIAGPAAVLTWIIAGILMMIVAGTFVMLTRAMPIAGGTVRFFQMSYGHFAGFSFSWIAWLAWVAVSPIETMALVQYSSNYIPGLMTNSASPVLTHMGMIVSIACMSVITVINNYGVRAYEKVNYIALAFKLIIPVVAVILLFSSQFHVQNFSQHAGFLPYGIKSIFSALPLAGVIYSFIGFNPAIQLASESKNPRKAIPIAIFGALAVCIILYSVIQVAFIGALSGASLQHGWSALRFAGDHGPFVGLLAGFGFVIFVKVLYVDAVVSPFGTAVVQSMATSRLTYGMSKNGYFPKTLMKTNKYATPKRALLLNMLIGFAFFLPFPSWQHMVGFLVSCLVLGYVIGPMSLSILTRTHPQHFGKLPQKWVHVFCITAFYICNMMIFWSGWDVIYKVMIMFIVGYVILALKICFNKGKGPLASLDIVRGSWVIVYMLGMTVISYLSSFGGIHVIPFGIDFGIVGIFSSAIYILAQYLASRTKAPLGHSQFAAISTAS